MYEIIIIIFFISVRQGQKQWKSEKCLISCNTNLLEKKNQGTEVDVNSQPRIP